MPLPALGCALAALCYAEFAAMAPVAGSAYTYAYTTLGEIFAWIIGWDLILEYAMGCATVASAWTNYFNELLARLAAAGRFPPRCPTTPSSSGRLHGILNLPSVLIMAVVTVDPGAGHPRERTHQRHAGGWPSWPSWSS